MNSSTHCSGQSTYRKEQIEEAVMKAVNAFFKNVKGTPSSTMIKTSMKMEQELQKKALQDAERHVEEARKEYTAIQDEIMKALMGEGRFEVGMLQEMATQRKSKLEGAISELARIAEHMASEEALVNDAQRELEQVLEWGAIFDITSLGNKRMILARIIERVMVSRGYKIHIEFKLTMRQFCGDTVNYISDTGHRAFAIV